MIQRTAVRSGLVRLACIGRSHRMCWKPETQNKCKSRWESHCRRTRYHGDIRSASSDVFIRLRNYVYTACMCHVMRAPPEAFWPSLLGVPARSLQGRTASDKSWAWRPLNEVNHAKVHAQSWCLPHIHRSNVLRLVRSALPVWHIHIHPMIASISVDKCSTTHSSCCLVLEDAYIPHYYSG